MGLTSEEAEARQDKVAICHNGHTIEVARAALRAHQGHGDDTTGACEGTVETTVEPTTEPITEPTVVSEASLTGKVTKTKDSKYALKTKRDSTIMLETKKQDKEILEPYVGKIVEAEGNLTTSEGKGKAKTSKSKTKKLEVERITEKR